MTAPPYKLKKQDKLAALFGPNSDDSAETTSLPIDAIALWDAQPRKYYDEERIAQLADTYRVHGILEPLIVRPIENAACSYQVIAGARRFLSAKKVGMQEVPVKILSLTDAQAMDVAHMENAAREELNPLEDTEYMLSRAELRLNVPREACVRIIRAVARNQEKAHGLTITDEHRAIVKELFADTGMSISSFVTSRLTLLSLPDHIKSAILRGDVPYSFASKLRLVKDDVLLADLIRRIADKALTRLELEQAIADYTAKTRSTPGISKTSETISLLQRIHRLDLSEETQDRVNKLLDELHTLLSAE